MPFVPRDESKNGPPSPAIAAAQRALEASRTRLRALLEDHERATGQRVVSPYLSPSASSAAASPPCRDPPPSSYRGGSSSPGTAAPLHGQHRDGVGSNSSVSHQQHPPTRAKSPHTAGAPLTPRGRPHAGTHHRPLAAAWHATVVGGPNPTKAPATAASGNGDRVRSQTPPPHQHHHPRHVPSPSSDSPARSEGSTTLPPIGRGAFGGSSGNSPSSAPTSALPHRAPPLQAREQPQPQQHQQSLAYSNVSKAVIHQGSTADAAAPAPTTTATAPCYTVANMPSAGGLFEAIKAALVRRGDWAEVTVPGLAELKGAGGGGGPASRGSRFSHAGHHLSARGGSSSSGGGGVPCCCKTFGTHLFMGEKLLVEKLIAEARIVAMRAARHSSSSSHHHAAAAATGPRCRHAHPRVASFAAPPTFNMVNYLEGTRAITLKSRMLRTLVAFHQHSGTLDDLWRWLPETYVLTPHPHHRGRTSVVSGALVATDDRDTLIDAMKTANDANAHGEVSTWIAKSSHGCHGDGIKIVKATAGGLRDLLQYIDGFNDTYPWVVCRYVDRPLLHDRRKFDIRAWVLVTADWEVYFHRDLVMRLSSVPYDSRALTTDTPEGLLANITNHCIQTQSDTYGAREEGNELWWADLVRLLRATVPRRGGAGHGAAASSPSPVRTLGAAGPMGAGHHVPDQHVEAGDSPPRSRQPPHTAMRSPSNGTAAAAAGSIGGGGGPEDHVFEQMAHIVRQSVAACRHQMGMVESGTGAAARQGVVPPPSQPRHGSGSGGGGGISRSCSSRRVAGETGRGTPTTPSLTPLADPPSEEASSHSSKIPPPPSSACEVEPFQMFGFDFLIDSHHNVWLLEINGSPGVAERLMGPIVEDFIELVLNPVFPPLQKGTANSNNHRRVNKFQKIFPL